MNHFQLLISRMSKESQQQQELTSRLSMIHRVFDFVGLRLYVPVNNFSVMLGRFPGVNQYKAMKMECLAQECNTTPRVRFEPTTLPSRVHYTTVEEIRCVFDDI